MADKFDEKLNGKLKNAPGFKNAFNFVSPDHSLIFSVFSFGYDRTITAVTASGIRLLPYRH